MKSIELIKRLEGLHPDTEVAILCEHGRCVPVHYTELRGLVPDIDRGGRQCFTPIHLSRSSNPETVAVLK